MVDTDYKERFYKNRLHVRVNGAGVRDNVIAYIEQQIGADCYLDEEVLFTYPDESMDAAWHLCFEWESVMLLDRNTLDGIANALKEDKQATVYWNFIEYSRSSSDLSGGSCRFIDGEWVDNSLSILNLYIRLQVKNWNEYYNGDDLMLGCGMAISFDNGKTFAHFKGDRASIYGNKKLK